MSSAVAFCSQGGGLREAARKYNVPLATLHRRVNGSVKIGCKPGPDPVLPPEAEKKLYDYIIEMADMGFGLSRQEIMFLAYQIAEKGGIKHPFRGESAGRKWFDGFRRRYPTLTLRSPQSLSFARAKAANPKIMEDFFAKLGSVYARLNLLTKPMQVYNVDESGINLVQHRGKVVTEIGRRSVHRVVASEKGKNHTVIACGSASGQVVPPMLIFPRVRVPSHFKENAPPGCLLAAQKKGWVNGELYLEWFKFFIQQIPPARPVLLIQDGHSSHITIDLIELAKKNDIHILCLPSHTTHVLQPLDVGVFASFKTNIGKVLNALLRSSPGRVPTTEDIPYLLSQVWPRSVTAINLMSGFRKTGIFPLNPGCIRDRECAPSTAIAADTSFESSLECLDTSASTENSVETHAPSSGASALSDILSQSSESSALSLAMDSLLIKPQLKKKTMRKQKKAYNHTTVCVTDDQFLKKLKNDKAKKVPGASGPSSKPPLRQKKKIVVNKDSESDSDCECPICGQHYGDVSATWIQCEKCKEWYDTVCVDVDASELPDICVIIVFKI